MATDKTLVMALRVPKPLLKVLHDLAHTERRPFGMQMLIVIEEGLKAMGRPFEQKAIDQPRRRS